MRPFSRLAVAAMFALAVPVSARAQNQDIVETAGAQGQFGTLVRLLNDAGLTETLKGPGPFTVFAPTDAAFAKLPASVLSTLAKDKSALRNLLLYHVIAGRITAADVAKLNGRGAKTVEGTEAKVAITGADVTINGARVTQPDIAARNGVIHAVDTVIIPPGR